MFIDPIAEIFWNLRRWSSFPKYALERRLDIFLTPYLPRFLSDQLGTSVRLVAPEFPIKHGTTRLSVNADYLFHAAELRTWILLELKTDPRSVDDGQREIYECVSPRGDGDDVMARLMGDLATLKKGSKLGRKYARLVSHVAPLVHPGDRVVLAYLSPRCPSVHPQLFFRIRDFARWTPPLTGRRDKVWRLVSRLLRRIEDGAPASGDRVPWSVQGMGGGEIAGVSPARGRWASVSVAYQAGCIVGPGDAAPPRGVTSYTREEFEAKETAYWKQQHLDLVQRRAGA